MDIGHSHPLNIERIIDVNNDVAGKFIFERLCIDGKDTANVQTQQHLKYHT